MDTYSDLIAKECLNDIEIDQNDKAAVTRHLNIVKNEIKKDFGVYMKNKAMAKKK